MGERLSRTVTHLRGSFLTIRLFMGQRMKIQFLSARQKRCLAPSFDVPPTRKIDEAEVAENVCIRMEIPRDALL